MRKILGTLMALSLFFNSVHALAMTVDPVSPLIAQELENQIQGTISDIKLIESEAEKRGHSWRGLSDEDIRLAGIATFGAASLFTTIMLMIKSRVAAVGPVKMGLIAAAVGVAIFLYGDSGDRYARELRNMSDGELSRELFQKREAFFNQAEKLKRIYSK